MYQSIALVSVDTSLDRADIVRQAEVNVLVVFSVEPKYSDPLSGATPTFQQRLMELAALEAETVRWERTKKVKKKPKQDRDS